MFNWTQSDGALDSYGTTLGSELSTNIVVSTIPVSVRAACDYRLYECKASNDIGEMVSPCRIAVVQPGKAEAPINCQINNLTDSSLDVVCIPTFDGGSKPHFAISLKSAKINGGEFVVKSNLSDPTFAVFGLLPSTEYYFQVCVSNAEFWKEVDCTQESVFTTSESNVTLSQAGLVSPEMLPLVIASTVIGVLIIVLVVAVLVMTKGQCHRCRHSQADVNKSSTSIEMNPPPSKSNLRPSIVTVYEDSIHSENGKNRSKKVTRFSDQECVQNPAQIWLGPDDQRIQKDDEMSGFHQNMSQEDNSDPDTADTFISNGEESSAKPATPVVGDAPTDERKIKPYLSRSVNVDDNDDEAVEHEGQESPRKASIDVTAVIQQLRAESAERRTSLDSPPPPLPPRSSPKPAIAKRNAPVVANDSHEHPQRLRPALSFLEAIGDSSTSESEISSSFSSEAGEERFIEASISPDDVQVDANLSNTDGQTTDGEYSSANTSQDDSASFTIRDDFEMDV
ncbi:uncharacterized protein LOC141899070 [Tubulanus polymorphus]|uniref:uncharacterized protein LOC141899070 n=1 Tax=Tubulanus polymorphus TaxID=672921 RepID=UPI003DA3F0BC